MLNENEMNSLFQLLLHNEEHAASRVYLRQPIHRMWYEYTWAEVMLQARKIAGFLHQLGLKRGSHVSIISKNCAEWFITDFGIHLAGMVNVPLFANQHKESIHYVLEHANVKLVFVGKLDDHQRVRRFIPEHYLTVGFDFHKDLEVDYRWSDILANPPLMDIIEPEPDDLYTIIYSSGTTRLPKGAMYTNQSITNYLNIFLKDRLRVSDLDHYRLVSYLPLAHVYERSAIQLASVVLHCDVSFIESLDKFVDNLRDIQPTLFTAVPRIWGVFQQKIEQKIAPGTLRFLLKTPLISKIIKKKIINGLGFNSCTNYFSGASFLPLSIINFFDQLGIYIQEGYGQTENMAYATVTLLEQRKAGYVGTPRLGVDIRVNKENELEMNTPCMMSGYYKDKKSTQAAFTADGWLRTGDLVVLGQQGEVKILGRISENFKNQSGEFVAPTPIEKQFESNELIDQLCLVGQGLPHNILLITLPQSIRGHKKRKEINRQLQNYLRQVNSTLITYEKISHIIVAHGPWTVNNEMLTPTMKVKRKNVEERYNALIQEVLSQSQVIVWEKSFRK